MKKILIVMLATVTALSMSVSSFAVLIGSGASPTSSGTPIGSGAAPASSGGAIGSGAYPISDTANTPTGSVSYKSSAIAGLYDADGYVVDWGGTVNPGGTYYIELSSDTDFSAWASSSTNARMSVRKIKNGALIKSVALVEKRLNSGARKSYLQVVLKDTTSAEEIRADFSVTFTSKKDMNETLTVGKKSPFNLKRNETLVLDTTLYVSNENVEGGDTSVTVGKNGVYVQPISGETNEVIFEDANGTLAVLTFDAASNPDKFYAKVTTNWTTTTVKKFQNTDAVIRTFYPATIDSRSRARLALANPYDSERQNPAKVWIYSIDSKGVVKDISKTFKYNTALDAYTTSVRTLGTYVISNVKVTTTK